MNALLDELLAPPIQERLAALGEKMAADYQSASPFPHAVIDDFLPPELVRRAAEAFPEPGHFPWEKFEGEHEKKLGFYKAELLPPPTRDMLYFLNSAPMLQFLEKMTGIKALIADPYFFGGGLHQTVSGGRLGIHADFSYTPQLNVDRRLNFLLYLNEDWLEEYGGHLQLWSQDMSRCERRILPIFNRCVVFTTTSTSFHGQPEPLACPEGRARRSIATYYYTSSRGEAPRERHSTLFRVPGEPPDPATPAPSAAAPCNGSLKSALKCCVPPILLDAFRALRR